MYVYVKSVELEENIVILPMTSITNQLTLQETSTFLQLDNVGTGNQNS